MKAVQIVKPEDLRVIDIEKPVIDEKQCSCKNDRCRHLRF